MNSKTKKKLLSTKCVKCGTTYGLEVDHIIPKMFGTTLEKANRQVLCIKCNREKDCLAIDYTTKTFIVQPYQFKLNKDQLRKLLRTPVRFDKTVILRELGKH